MFRGYGPFSAQYDINAEHVVGAKAVSSEGELVEASGESCNEVMDAGGIFVELTVKVSPFKETDIDGTD
ncbi:hypothetical protein F4802DRAFT_601868 [Xylaria palmicola]|nr:hypothetical protein F4802DRAFT_601868 [Xylaria palmicola]